MGKVLKGEVRELIDSDSRRDHTSHVCPVLSASSCIQSYFIQMSGAISLCAVGSNTAAGRPGLDYSTHMEVWWCFLFLKTFFFFYAFI